MNTDASILVYKFRPERTGFNMYAEYTQLQLTFLALVPCLGVGGTYTSRTGDQKPESKGSRET